MTAMIGIENWVTTDSQSA